MKRVSPVQAKTLPIGIGGLSIGYPGSSCLDGWQIGDRLWLRSRSAKPISLLAQGQEAELLFRLLQDHLKLHPEDGHVLTLENAGAQSTITRFSGNRRNPAMTPGEK